ncbi:MAG: CAP domain-containing protein [Deltaproteobacteria bacterium]|nr:CAP domain-containing protein [Deltaproteobacteria bacterium]
MLKTAVGAFLLFIVLDLASQAPPVVERYHEAIPSSQAVLSQEEAELVDFVFKSYDKADRQRPEPDPNLHLACRTLCEVLDCSDVSGLTAWEPQTIQFTLRRFGVTDGFYFPLVVHVESMADARRALGTVISQDVVPQGVNRFGVAVDLEHRQLLVVVFTRRLAQLGPFARQVEPGESVLLWGGLTTGSKKPRLLLSTPEGALFDQPLKETQGLFWTHVFFPDEAGEYAVEILVERDGPQVASLFPVYVGIPVPERPVFKVLPDVDEGAAAGGLERQMLSLINRERAKRSLPACGWSSALADGCRKYSRGMANEGRLSHSLERSAGDYTENISLSTSLHAAHTNLMGSPSHRRNILDREAVSCGVGIVAVDRGEGVRLLYITQRFGRK